MPGVICFVWPKELTGVVSNQVFLLVSLEFFFFNSWEQVNDLGHLEFYGNPLFLLYRDKNVFF